MGLFSRNKKESAPAKAAPKPTTAAAPAAVPKPAPVKPNETALLKEDLERKIKALDKKTDSLTTQINKEIAKAKEYLTAGDKRRAAECMRRKNNWEKQRDNNMAKIRKYEDQVNLMDETATNKTALEDLAAVNEHVQKLQVDPDRVDNIMDQMRDNQMKQEEINQILGEDTGEFYDEDEGLEELEKMMQADRAKEALASDPLAGAAPVPSQRMPAPSSSAKVEAQPQAEEEDELAKLEKEMQIGM